jgi:cardiolipin synthase
MSSRPYLLTVPNALTVLRLAVIPFFIVASLRSAYSLALVLFIAAGLTDIVDGFIARRFNQHSKLGAILDPAADKVMIFSGYLVYTFHAAVLHRLPPWLTMTLFVRDALIIFFAYLLYTRIQIRRFPPSVAGKISTLLQVIALSATIAANTDTALGLFVLPFLGPGYKITLAVTLYSGFDYLRRGSRMLQAAEG